MPTEPLLRAPGAADRSPCGTPHQYAGTPAWADPQLAVLYPFRFVQTLIALPFGRLPIWAVEIEAYVHVILGALFTAGLLRQLGAVRLAALFGASCFAFGGYLSAYPMQQLAVLDTAIWIPALLWAITYYFDCRSMEGSQANPSPVSSRKSQGKALVLAAICLAMVILAGHPQTALYAIWAGCSYWLWLAFSHRSKPSESRTSTASLKTKIFASPLFGLGSALALGAGLSAAQWWPSLDFLRRSARDLSTDEIAAGLPPSDVLQILAPGTISQWSPLHIGIVGLVLALWAALFVPRSRIWVFAAGLAWLISMGGNTPFFAIFEHLPGLKLFRHQERIAVLYSLGMSVAAGLGADALFRQLSTREQLPAKDSTRDQTDDARGMMRMLMDSKAGMAGLFKSTGLVFVTLVLLGSALKLQPVPPDWAPASASDFCQSENSLAAGTSTEAVAASTSGSDSAITSNSAITSIADLAGLADPLLFSALIIGLALIILRLAGQGGWTAKRTISLLLLLLLFELFSVHRGRALCPYEPMDLEHPQLQALEDRARDGRVSSEAGLPGGPNAASIFGLYDVTGDSPLQLGSSVELIETLPEIAWWRILGVRYSLSARDPGDAPLIPLPLENSDAVENPETDAKAGPEPTLYEVDLPAPPVWIPQRIVCPESGAEPSALEALSAIGGRLDPTNQLILEPADRIDVCEDANPMAKSALRSEPGKTWILEDSDNDPGIQGTANLVGLETWRASVEVDMQQAGFLVFANAYDPHWRVRVESLDGSESPSDARVRKAYGAIMAVEVPAGQWRIKWTYLPQQVILGLMISVISMLIGMFGLRFGIWNLPPSESQSA